MSYSNVKYDSPMTTHSSARHSIKISQDQLRIVIQILAIACQVDGRNPKLIWIQTIKHVRGSEQQNSSFFARLELGFFDRVRIRGLREHELGHRE